VDIVRCAVCSAELTEADRVEALPDGTMPRHVDFFDCLKATLDRFTDPIVMGRAYFGLGPTPEKAIADVIARAVNQE
jgi:hypothetical protein